ncbi:MAG: hypothetical protein KatS3mg104_1140 [Phycisphaerae bacterium]|jgi:prepilin-type N-terminal cleavage/methylation domain-containing protein|nr:MAG: hypothetical protein KatS3mg104_1140 [Phycisphaerae bacterium]
MKLKLDQFNSRSAFTLVELLVVIGVVAILISILLPAFMRIRDSSHRVKCASNLHQLGVAVQLYALQNNGYVIPAFKTLQNNFAPNYISEHVWDTFLVKQLRSSRTLTCPADVYQSWNIPSWMSLPAAWSWRVGPNNKGAYWNTGYIYVAGALNPPGNSYFRNPSQHPVRLSQGTSRMLMAADLIYIQNGAWQSPHVRRASRVGPLSSQSTKPLLGQNQLFYDGHVTWKRGEDFPPVFNSATTPPQPPINMRFQHNDTGSANWAW